MKPLARLVELVAAAPTFIARAGIDSDDPTTASQLIAGEEGVKKIFYPVAEIDDIQHFPAAVVRVKSLEFGIDSGGAQNYLLAGGVLSLLLIDRGRYESDLESSARDFMNFAGDTLADIAQQFAVNDNLAGYQMKTFWGPDYEPLTTSDGVIERWMCGIEVMWGG